MTLRDSRARPGAGGTSVQVLLSPGSAVPRFCWVLLPAPGAPRGRILVQLQNSLSCEVSGKYKVCHCHVPRGMEERFCCSVPESWDCCWSLSRAFGGAEPGLGEQPLPPGNVIFELSGSPQAAAPLPGVCWDVSPALPGKCRFSLGGCTPGLGFEPPSAPGAAGGAPGGTESPGRS